MPAAPVGATDEKFFKRRVQYLKINSVASEKRLNFRAFLCILSRFFGYFACVLTTKFIVFLDIVINIGMYCVIGYVFGYVILRHLCGMTYVSALLLD